MARPRTRRARLVPALHTRAAGPWTPTACRSVAPASGRPHLGYPLYLSSESLASHSPPDPHGRRHAPLSHRQRTKSQRTQRPRLLNPAYTDGNRDVVDHPGPTGGETPVAHRHVEPPRTTPRARRADAVQTARHRVAVAAERSAG